MRITSATMLLNAVRQLRAGQTTLSRAQSEAATGRRVNTMSDDPVSAASILHMQAEVREIDQFTRNGASATTRLSTEDSLLATVQSVLADARKVAMNATSNDPASPERQAALAQVNTMIEQMVSLGNTKIGGEYVLGGRRTDQPPFLADGTFVGDTTARQVEVDHGVTMSVNHTGDQVVSPAIAALQQLRTQIQSGTPQTIQATVTPLTAAGDTALQAQSAVGSRLLQVKQTAQDLGRRSAVLLDQRDAIRDVDPAEASVRLLASQSALERAYAVIGKVFSTSLINYLR
jgi:flagellar hook-associated protein 3 FlgL